jgi:hypothetical protein
VTATCHLAGAPRVPTDFSILLPEVKQEPGGKEAGPSSESLEQEVGGDQVRRSGREGPAPSLLLTLTFNYSTARLQILSPDASRVLTCYCFPIKKHV